MLRAVFEGVAFSIADAAAVLPEFANASVLYLAGGGTLQRSWRQLLCDLLGKRLLAWIHRPTTVSVEERAR